MALTSSFLLRLTHKWEIIYIRNYIYGFFYYVFSVRASKIKCCRTTACEKRKKNLYLIFVSRLFNLDIFLSYRILSFSVPPIDISVYFFVSFVSLLLLPYTDYIQHKKTSCECASFVYLLFYAALQQKKEEIASKWH